jgi:hypothetical protein
MTMPPDIDLTRGGYGGDSIEEEFKWFTGNTMEYWWHFREVLWAADRKSTAHWRMIDGSVMCDDDHRKLIAVSLLNYAVYTGIAEALSFFFDLKSSIAQGNLFHTRRAWKSMYSSLYSSFNAFSNLAYIVICNKSPFGKDPTNPRNPSLQTIKDELGKVNASYAIQAIENTQARMEIRNQLDHWWTIWTGFIQEDATQPIKFKLDHNFRKGYILLEADQEVDWKRAYDALQRGIDEITGCAVDFNHIYKEMARTGGALDKYLTDNGWELDYSPFGEQVRDERTRTRNHKKISPTGQNGSTAGTCADRARNGS